MPPMLSALRLNQNNHNHINHLTSVISGSEIANDGVSRRSTSFCLDAVLSERLNNVGCNLKGGVSRIIEDCVRAYLPVIEQSQRKEQQETNGNGLRENFNNNNSLVPPEALKLLTDLQNRTNLCQNAEKQDTLLLPQEQCLRCVLSYAFDKLFGGKTAVKEVSDE